MASYPPSLASWATKRDFIDPIWARHFNIVQDEIKAIELTLGINPQIATADPAELTPDYTTVANRVQKSARREPFCSYRGIRLDDSITPNQHVRPELTASEDTHGASTQVGYRLPETGYWVINAMATWPSTPATAVHPTTRVMGIEINGTDLGLRESVLETVKNRDNLSTMVVWQERMSKGTDISLSLRAVNADPDKTSIPVNVYLRVYLVRCTGTENVTGLPSPEFKEIPVTPPTLPPGPVSQVIMREPDPPKPPAQRKLGMAIERYDGSYNVYYADGGLAYVSTQHQLGTNGPDS
ncbi:hypothetical protein AB0G15_05410 [Streptosporangium sp. NPDC023825]|uniref:hypothetical protein n=1 Tax=Streptosporangium sp. NPDC023825 TaxID=3154909 RepID=UPI00343135CD